MAANRGHEQADYLKWLEVRGEDEVRTLLATGKIGEANHRKRLAEDWLRRKDQERADALAREQVEFARYAASSARDAADSARETAREAREANRIAKRANKIAIAAIAAAIIS